MADNKKTDIAEQTDGNVHYGMKNHLIKLWFVLTWMANQSFNEILPPMEEDGKQNIDSVYLLLLVALGKFYQKKKKAHYKQG